MTVRATNFALLDLGINGLESPMRRVQREEFRAPNVVEIQHAVVLVATVNAAALHLNRLNDLTVPCVSFFHAGGVLRIPRARLRLALFAVRGVIGATLGSILLGVLGISSARPYALALKNLLAMCLVVGTVCCALSRKIKSHYLAHAGGFFFIHSEPE